MTQRHSRAQSLRAALLAIVAGGLLAAGPAEAPVILMIDGPVQVGSGEPPIWRDAQVKPAPNATSMTRSSGLTRPPEMASCSAIGIEAEDVFP